MSKINLLLTLLSLTAVIVIVERLSPTTKIILQPYSFLRVHEVFQMSVVIAISIVISFLILKYVTNEFELLRTKFGIFWGCVFILGIYFTATGNGLHEVASYLYNTFCNTKIIGKQICAASFFDDFYFGNAIYFIGLFLGNVSLIILEKEHALKKTTTTQSVITVANGILYGLALLAYAAFDRVAVGLWFVGISALSVLVLLAYKKKNLVLTPFALYSIVSYSLAFLLTLLFRR